MIDRFTEIWPTIERSLTEKYSVKAPGSYDGIMEDLVTEIHTHLEDSYYGETPDPERITVIDHGDYQGTRVWVIGATGYQPNNYFVAKVYYGSCSGCDTFQAIYSESWDDTPTESQAKAYVTLAMHMLQGMKEV